MAFNIESKSKFVPAWNDNKESDKPIEIELKYLNQSDYWSAMSVLKKMPVKSEKAETEGVAPELMAEISRTLAPIFQKSIDSITNLTMDNKPVKPALIAEHPKLIGLMTELMIELINRSSISSTDKKK